MSEGGDLDSVRLDRWLWAARFFKTRSQASTAVHGGKVQVNGDRAKAGKSLRIRDRVRVRLGPYEHTVIVKAISERRGSGADAAKLFDETTDSLKARERLALQMRTAPVVSYEGKGRPTKKDRRELEKFKDD